MLLCKAREKSQLTLKMQSHQNKFHLDALRNLTAKFASLCEGEAVSTADQALWSYFSTLYKNSNKGIKGRGRDRRISNVSAALGLKSQPRRGSLIREIGNTEEADNFGAESGRDD